MTLKKFKLGLFDILKDIKSYPKKYSSFIGGFLGKHFLFIEQFFRLLKLFYKK